MTKDSTLRIQQKKITIKLKGNNNSNNNKKKINEIEMRKMIEKVIKVKCYFYQKFQKICQPLTRSTK